MAFPAMGYLQKTVSARVGLAQPSGFRLIGAELHLAGRRVDGVHGYGVVGAAHHLAQVTTLTAAGDHNGLFRIRVQKDAIGLGTVHDAKPTSFFGDTFAVIYKRDVIH
jgi:hypothetical protein